MKYIHIYNNRTEYNAVEKEIYDMSLIRNEDNLVLFSKNVPNIERIYEEEYFTIEITQGGYFTVAAAIQNVTKAYSPLNIDYSFNEGDWISTQITRTGLTFNCIAGDSIRFRGTNTTYCNNLDAGNNTHKQWYVIFGIVGHDDWFGEEDAHGANYYKNIDEFMHTTCKFNVCGNIMSLLYGDNFVGQTTLPSTYTFANLFKTSNVVSAEHLILPSTTLTKRCYSCMFSKAYYLETSPEFIAETLSSECMHYAFETCESLTKITFLATNANKSTNTNNFMSGTPDTSDCIFIKNPNVTAASIKTTCGIPENWTIQDYV